MRILTISAAFLALSSAFLLYGLNYDTRRLEARVEAQERTAEKTRSDIAVLKADRAHLARPERIEPLARSLGLQPATEKQFAREEPAPGVITGSTSR
jgi:cell division protein FtsL